MRLRGVLYLAPPRSEHDVWERQSRHLLVQLIAARED